MKLAIQDRLTGCGASRESFGFARELGFDGVEINLFQQPLEDGLAQEIYRAAEASGLPVAAICGGYRHWIGHVDEEKRLVAVADICRTLSRAARIGAEGVIAPAAYGMFSKALPPFHPPRGEEADRSALLDSLGRIAEAAERERVFLYLEPLNRYEDHMVNTVKQAVSLVEAVGSPYLRVLGDFFHMNIEEADIAAAIRQHSRWLGYFHLADSNRRLPGRGHTDFSRPFAVLRESGFSGWLSLECRVSEERRRQELEEALAELRRLIQAHTTAG